MQARATTVAERAGGRRGRLDLERAAREVVVELSGDCELITEEVRRRFAHVVDHLRQVVDNIDGLRELEEKGYIVGELSRVIFYEPGVKETNWSVTAVLPGIDGVERRWVSAISER